jgi:hypothetical protein
MSSDTTSINSYLCEVDSTILHDFIRLDAGVKLIEHNVYIEWDLGEMESFGEENMEL